MEEDLAMLFGVEDDSSGDEEEVGGSSTVATEGHSFTLLAPEIPVPPSGIKDLCTRMGNLEYGHGLLVKKVITVSDAEVADSIAIGEIGPRVSTVEGQMQVLTSQMVQVVSRLEQFEAHVKQGQQAATQRDEAIAGLSQQCILGFDRWLADVDRRPPGPQHVDIPESHGKMVRWLDDEIPGNQIPTLKRDLLGVARFLRWVESKVVSSEVESDKWSRLLLHQMCAAIAVATDGREEDFLPRNEK
ncbi:hypothetical protein Tco_1315669 [Tanacetum coccineum]